MKKKENASNAGITGGGEGKPFNSVQFSASLSTTHFTGEGMACQGKVDTLTEILCCTEKEVRGGIGDE